MIGCLDPINRRCSIVGKPILESLRESFPSLKDLTPPLLDRFSAESKAVAFPDRTELFTEGDRCGGLLATISGTIRVSKTTEGGRELLLYEVRPGEMCVLTLTCLLGEGAYPARGSSSGEVKGAMIPQSLFNEMVDRVPRFRAAVFSSLGERVAQLMQLVEEVAFHRLDQRLAALLVRETERDRTDEISLTHQEIAERLGTSREIVSRVLGSFELQGLVQLGRKRIAIVDRLSLKGMAGGGV